MVHACACHMVPVDRIAVVVAGGGDDDVDHVGGGCDLHVVDPQCCWSEIVGGMR